MGSGSILAVQEVSETKSHRNVPTVVNVLLHVVDKCLNTLDLAQNSTNLGKQRRCKVTAKNSA